MTTWGLQETRALRKRSNPVSIVGGLGLEPLISSVVIQKLIMPLRNPWRPSLVGNARYSIQAAMRRTSG